MATILDTLKKGTEYLQKHGVEDARLSMEHLIAQVLGVGRMQIYLDFDRPLEESHLEILRDLTRRRSRGEPLQHLLGKVEFCGLEFVTDARALIPRPETEELVMMLLAREWPEGVAALDIGCGSGVIGLSLAHHWREKQTHVTLVDVSPDALALARENAERLGLPSGNLHWAESDLFSGVAGRFDLIVANLPYVPDGEKTAVSREVAHDPDLALYGGPDGTEIIARLLREVGAYLNPAGLLALEFGIGQADSLRPLAEDVGLGAVCIHSDLSGINRFLFATQTA
jgi:release factor glutamine methyltransferase